MPATDYWVDESNTITAMVMQAQAKFQPETFSSLGIESVDGDILDLEPNVDERFKEDTSAI